MRIVLIAIATLFFFSCKNDPKSNNGSNGDGQATLASTGMNNKPGPPIPDPCTLLSEAWIKSNLNVKDSSVTAKDGSAEKSNIARSCFFSWADPAMPNAAFMIQIFTNPAPEDLDNYPELFIQGKLSGSEMVQGQDEPVSYKKYDLHGDEGCYNDEVGYYYWRVKNDYVFWLAFNLPVDKATQKAYADKIGTEVMRNFKP
jgi:hypothetical protein